MKKIIIKGEKAIIGGRKALADLFLEKGGNLYNGAVNRANNASKKADDKLAEIKRKEEEAEQAREAFKMEDLEAAEEALNSAKADMKAKRAEVKKLRKLEKESRPSIGSKIKNFLFLDVEDDRIFLNEPEFFDGSFQKYTIKFNAEKLLGRNYDASILNIKYEDNIFRIVSCEEVEEELEGEEAKTHTVVMLRTSVDEMGFYIKVPKK